MKRIKVPDGMLKAAIAADSKDPKYILEAALLWASEHPQVPTDEQLDSLRKCFSRLDNRDRDLIINWQRRCFVQEEPEIPVEIEDLIWIDPTGKCKELHNLQLSEAYRRGLRKGEQK